VNDKRVHRPPHCQQIHPNIPELLLKEFDCFIEGKFENRTAAVHEAMRRFIKEASKE